MNSDTSPSDSGDLLKFTGALDIYAADVLRDALTQHLQSQPTLMIDLSGVNSCDVAALQLLYSARESAQSWNKPFVITALSSAVSDACTSLGLGYEELLQPTQERSNS